MFGSIGLPEILLVLAILLLIFGAGKISDIGKGLGEGVANFIKGVRSIKEDAKTTTEEPPEVPDSRKPS